MHIDIVNYLLVGVEFPDPVAPHHHEVDLRIQRHRPHVWERGDLLVLRRKSFIFLVGQVANRPRQVQVPVDTALSVHKAARALNACPLRRIRWLVVEGKRGSFAKTAHDTARVASIGAVEHRRLIRGGILGHVEDHVGGAAFFLHVLFFFGLLLHQVLKLFVVFHALHL